MIWEDKHWHRSRPWQDRLSTWPQSPWCWPHSQGPPSGQPVFFPWFQIINLKSQSHSRIAFAMEKEPSTLFLRQTNTIRFTMKTVTLLIRLQIILNGVKAKFWLMASAFLNCILNWSVECTNTDLLSRCSVSISSVQFSRNIFCQMMISLVMYLFISVVTSVFSLFHKCHTVASWGSWPYFQQKMKIFLYLRNQNGSENKSLPAI